MDTTLTQKFPFILDRNLAKANCTGNRVCTACDTVVLGDCDVSNLTFHRRLTCFYLKFIFVHNIHSDENANNFLRKFELLSQVMKTLTLITRPRRPKKDTMYPQYSLTILLHCRVVSVLISSS